MIAEALGWKSVSLDLCRDEGWTLFLSSPWTTVTTFVLCGRRE